MASLDALAAGAATADVDVELANDRAARDLGLELSVNLGLVDGPATVGASLGQGGIESLVDAVRRRSGAVAMPAMGGTTFAARFLGLSLGRAFGEGSGLTFARSACRIDVGFGLVEFASQAFVLAAEMVVLSVELFDFDAEFLQLLDEGPRC
jgi:hypothetical protein